MPELPEVETIRRDLENRILGKTFQTVRVINPFVLRNTSKEFIVGIQNQSITAVSRRGKALLIHLSNGQYLLIQVMMTGQLIVNGTTDKHTHVLFEFKDRDKLQYNDIRKFGQLRVIKQLSESKHLSILGPEPFGKDFTPEYVFQKTRGSKRPIKNLLLDHTFVAGIGNIYACEILFRCKINPTRLSGKLTQSQAKDIHKQSIEVLKEAIKHRGSSMRNYLDASGKKGGFNLLVRVYAKEGKPCVRCKTAIKRIIQAGRSTFYCPKCQR